MAKATSPRSNAASSMATKWSNGRRASALPRAAVNWPGKLVDGTRPAHGQVDPALRVVDGMDDLARPCCVRHRSDLPDPGSDRHALEDGPATRLQGVEVEGLDDGAGAARHPRLEHLIPPPDLFRGDKCPPEEATKFHPVRGADKSGSGSVSLEEFGGADSEGVGQPMDVEQRDVSLPAFDLCHVAPVRLGPLGQHPLRPAEGLAPPAAGRGAPRRSR